MGYCFLALSALLCLACVSDNGHPVLIYVWTQTVSYNSGRYKWSSLVYFLRILPTSVGSYEDNVCIICGNKNKACNE